MFCILCLILQLLAVVVEGGVSSGSAEALAKGAVNTKGGTGAGVGAKAVGQNGVPANGEPIVARLVQLGGSFFLQPLGGSVGQTLIPIAGLQQGGTFLPGQASGATVNLQGQMNQQAGGGPVLLYTVLPQRGAGGDPQHVLLTPGQVQLISAPGTNNQPQLSGAANGGVPNGVLRFQRSVAARLRRTQPPQVKPTAAEEEEEEEEEEESSGDAVEEKEMK